MRPIENGLSRSSTLELKIIMEIVFFFSFKLLNNVWTTLFQYLSKITTVIIIRITAVK